MPYNVAPVPSGIDHPVVWVLTGYLFLLLDVELSRLALTSSVLQSVGTPDWSFVDRCFCLIRHIVETFFIVVVIVLTVIAVVKGALLIRRLLFVLADLTF